ncbi:hypothetical protein L915_13301 [Phytophthora nicotianae]|uniref:Uncharacterized protein n=1 Tax=Phytophthora nicotianae TaxID=4792 RepID=W2GE17_PHYNI|nr:hypothetical protein L915_13301 [Phytophthora nicotianae]
MKTRMGSRRSSLKLAPDALLGFSALWLDAVRVNIIVVMNVGCHHSCRYTPIL